MPTPTDGGQSPPRINRRQALLAGGVPLLGLGGGALRAAESARRVNRDPGGSPRPIQSCILIFCYGGPSHHDTWDMKPDAPREVRGDFNSIATSVPGLRVSEHLPGSARVMDRLAIVRGMHHPMRNHNSAAVEALCGRTPLKGDLELLANDPTTDFPCYGAAVSRLLKRESDAPPHVALPHVMYNVVMLPGQTAGFLGPRYEPFQVVRDPNAADFRVAEVELPGGMSQSAVDERQTLRERLNRSTPIDGAAVGGLNASYERAFSLLHSDRVRRAFDIGAERVATRERYGRNILGQSVLLARRLVESGVRFVSVHDKVHNGLDNWDTHVNNFGRLKDHLLPPCDRAFSTLVADLDERGLLDTTLVVLLGEFGRTPKINRDGGRDHWPDCYSVVLAGGGVRGGTTYGASDKLGALPDSHPTTPGDLAATIYWRFGLDPTATIHDTAGRPFRLAEGTPLAGLFV